MNTRWFVSLITIILMSSGCSSDKFDRASIKCEIERIIKIQEDAYGDQSPEAKAKTRATCMDSLVFIGGDDGGIVASADFYVNDLADGYIEKPHNKHFQIYENTVIVTSLHQGYKLLSNDTLLINSRSTKIFIRDGDSWKMSYVTYAPLPVSYSKTAKVDDKKLHQYVGEYRIDSVTAENMSVRDHKLISAVGNDEVELRSLNDSTFMSSGYLGKMVFSKDKKGNVSHYYYEWTDGQRIIFPKIK